MFGNQTTRPTECCDYEVQDTNYVYTLANLVSKSYQAFIKTSQALNEAKKKLEQARNVLDNTSEQFKALQEEVARRTRDFEKARRTRDFEEAAEAMRRTTS